VKKKTKKRAHLTVRISQDLRDRLEASVQTMRTRFPGVAWSMNSVVASMLERGVADASN
jgi:hypothetical protein